MLILQSWFMEVLRASTGPGNDNDLTFGQWRMDRGLRPVRLPPATISLSSFCLAAYLHGGLGGRDVAEQPPERHNTAIGTSKVRPDRTAKRCSLRWLTC